MNTQVTIPTTNPSISTSSSSVTTINPNDPPPHPLVTTVSLETGSPVEWHSEENYMFRPADFQPSLLEHYTHTQTASKIFPPQHHHDIIQILSSGPLDDLSISRPRSRLAWGVPVPGDPEHTIYVWFDALLVYLSGIGYPWRSGSGAERGWPVDLQIIGKDILRSVLLLALVVSSQLRRLQLPCHISSCNPACSRLAVAGTAPGTLTLDC
jgi:methionyl-tRNA synthetase